MGISREPDHWFGPLYRGTQSEFERSDAHVPLMRIEDGGPSADRVGLHQRHADRLETGAWTLVGLIGLGIIVAFLGILLWVFADLVAIVLGAIVGVFALMYLLGYVRDGLGDDLSDWR